MTYNICSLCSAHVNIQNILSPTDQDFRKLCENSINMRNKSNTRYFKTSRCRKYELVTFTFTIFWLPPFHNGAAGINTVRDRRLQAFQHGVFNKESNFLPQKTCMLISANWFIVCDCLSLPAVINWQLIQVVAKFCPVDAEILITLYNIVSGFPNWSGTKTHQVPNAHVGMTKSWTGITQWKREVRK